MHGNVLEWCADHYGSYGQTPTDGSAFVTDNEEARRILWGGFPWLCRSTFRLFISAPADAYYGVGFRVSCSAPRT